MTHPNGEMTPEQLAAYQAGFEVGRRQGHEEGIAAGYAEGVKAARVFLDEMPTERDISSPLALPIEDLNLTVRTYNILKREGVNNVGDLKEMSRAALLDLQNFGPRCLEEVEEALDKYSLELRD